MASPAGSCPGSMSASAFAMSTAAEPALARPSAAWQLPVELLLQCLIAADLVTRIRASHVSCTWREAALAERRLWDSFECLRFRDKRHEDAMLSLLEALLLRSRPLPFHLTVPHLDGRPGYDYTDRIFALEGLDVFRFAAYHGPTRLFRLLNATCAPLPNLSCLDLLRISSDGDPDITTIDLTGQFGARCLPNLRELAAPNVRFPTGGAPFGALRSITLDGIYGHHHRALFKHCPLLVRLSITNSARSTPLPDPPLPPSLEEISIGCTPSREIDILALMQHWHGIRVRRLVAREVYSMEVVLPLFLASHEHPIELRILGDDDQTVVLSTIPDNERVWTLSPSSDWAKNFLKDIENPASERLTSITIALSRLGGLLTAQLHTPGLEQLELRVDSAADADPLPLHTAGECFLRAPRLRNVSFSLGDDYPELLEDFLTLLRLSFRALFIYDAGLLDTITVSHGAARACEGFAPFAKEYVLVS